jgi:hypothetical protein
VTDNKRELSDALLSVQVTEIEPAIVRREETEFSAGVLANPHFDEEDRCHGLLNGRKVLLGEVTDGESIANAGKEDTKVVYPCMVAFA